MRRIVPSLLLFFSLCCLTLLPALAYGAGATPMMRGHVAAHDPSRVVKSNGRYYLFATGKNITSRSSADRVFWSAGPNVFTNPPAWTTNYVPGFVDTFWAPDVVWVSNRFNLYYSVSTWGSQVSAIGLASNPTLDPTDPAYRWTDHGPVIVSTNGSAYNTIDPSVTWDAAGNFWLVFGSYWNGIYLVQLDPATGLRLAPNSPTYRLADYSSIEAAGIIYRAGYYYLFVNWGSCCDGVDSTYQIRVGRSTSITGPYRDRNNTDMVSNGGTPFLQPSGKYVGPGHFSIFEENGQQLFSFHYYDANDYSGSYNAYGRAKFDMAPLSWTADGWPVFAQEWSAIYNFQGEARDENGTFYGLLQNGAAIAPDSARGRVLDLNGVDQQVWLPPGVAYAQTFAAVVKWRGGPAWQRIFDLGFDNTRFVMLTPSTGDNKLRCDFNTGSAVYTIAWNQKLPSNMWTHVATVFDGSRGILYVNGTAVATNTSVPAVPAAVRAQTNHLGHSKFAADANFDGQIASFRAYSRPLTSAEIVAPVAWITQPRSGEAWQAGQPIRFSGNATDYMAVPLAAANLAWSIWKVSGTTSNLVLGPVTGVTAGQYVVPPSEPGTNLFVVALAATDTLGRQTRVSVPLRAGVVSQPWSSYYPFNNGAQDASNLYSGTIYGGAAIQSEAVRGSVLNLSGSSQYVKLPSGAASARTISGWVKWRGGNSWQRIFDLGRDTTSWVYLTPKNGSGVMECALTTDRPTFVKSILAPYALPTNTWVHFAVTLDNGQGILYLNGRAVAVHNSTDLFPTDLGAVNVYFGRSQYSQDPYFNGQIDAFRLHGNPLDFYDLLDPAFFGRPKLSIAQSNDGVTLSWPEWAQSFGLFRSSPGFLPVWTWEATTPRATNSVLSWDEPISGGPAFYRLQLP